MLCKYVQKHTLYFHVSRFCDRKEEVLETSEIYHLMLDPGAQQHTSQKLFTFSDNYKYI